MYWAKSKPKETLAEHIGELLVRYDILRSTCEEIYPNSLMGEREWELLKIAVLYHDIGKADSVFQNVIRKALNMKVIPEPVKKKVLHGYLSVLAIPYDRYELKSDEKRILVQAVAYHHERDKDLKKEELVEVYENNILPNLLEIEENMGIEGFRLSDKAQKRAVDLIAKRINSAQEEIFLKYIMIKGLLHRLDHSASAHSAIELAQDCYPEEYVCRFIKEKIKKDLRPLQEYARANQDKHLLIMAQTGMGKTEASLLWLGKEKGFYTLPLRTSLNAMYKRLLSEKDIGFSKQNDEGEEIALGLLHSTSLDVLQDIEYDNLKKEGKREEEIQELLEERIRQIDNQSRNFANKLTISTIDQILKFAFLPKGFEKELSALAGAKIIIDEMQAYDPKLAALIIRALTLIDQVGGKFMIMTATMPNIYIKALENNLKGSRFELQMKCFYNDNQKRHKTKIKIESLMDDLESIIQNSKTRKVLVICNTVKRAKELYAALPEDINKFLLHSQFIRRDRTQKEKDLQEFEKQPEAAGIWITTQLVEASMDLDFDILFTEMSTLDSLFQRMGRCNRKGEKNADEINVYVYLQASGIAGKGKKGVYHYDINRRSVEILADYDNRILLESEKMDMIGRLYDNDELEGSEYKKEFIKTLQEFNQLPPYEVEKGEVQKFMRDINQVLAIPRDIFNEEGIELCEQYREETDRIKRRNIRRKLEQLTVGVYGSLERKYLSNSSIPDGLHDIFVIGCNYSKEAGIELDKHADNVY